jgi:cytochrome c553
MVRVRIAFVSNLCSLFFALGCNSSDSMGTPSTQKDASAATVDFEAQESDFECILDWDKVRQFYITNKVGKLTEALAVANAEGGPYPVGTIIELIPQEAMVKRRAGFSPETRDWEFFTLTPSATGTAIASRGTTKVTNILGSCADCHGKAEPKYDMVCENNHGCTPLGIGTPTIEGLQNSDPRCHD